MSLLVEEDKLFTVNQTTACILATFVPTTV